jgi:hypothetical protein
MEPKGMDFAALGKPPIIFMSKWRVVRSWLPCRERGTP